MIKNIRKFDAISKLVGGGISGDADGSLIDYHGKTPPTDAEIEAAWVTMQAEFSAQAYARNRQAEYPSITDLVVALYDTDDKSAIETKRAAVKLKYPKPE